MRREAPVWHAPNGHVHLFRHEDIMRVVTDPAVFSSDLVSKGSGGKQKPSGGQLLMLDPPDHGKLRRLVSKAFTAKMVAALEPRITEITEELLDAVAGADSFEMNDALANPLPVTVISMMLGVPGSDRDQFQQWANNLLAVDPEDPESVAGLSSTAEALGAYLQGFVDARRAEPQDDLISQLCAAEVDGEQLNDMEVINFSALLLLAGHITTSVLLGNLLMCLDERPELFKELREDRKLITPCIEETLRMRSPFTKVERVAMRDVEISGVQVASGSQLHLWLLSANRDDEVFDDPDTYDPDRHNAKQVAFGHGIHYCIGAPIARLEARIVLDLLLDRYTDVRVDRSEPVSFHGSNIFGARRLPLKVSRA
ncbi:cytochrome P450 [Streptomyces armeniacus]|uniref:Cytochrome P450 n=2 Tax=Streptomyces armeniacus TaxID=83291 RepID=A0A345Y1J0_9ACTN|nr:cytochrome P450 [Streptomyces armeniacus]